MYQKHVDAVLAAWNEGNLEGLDAVVDANVVRRSPASLNTDANSLAELKQVITDHRTTFPDTKVTIEEIFFQDDRSFSRWTFEGTNTGPGEFPPTGKAVKVEGSSFTWYQDGKVAEEIVYMDMMDMMTQLGLVQLPMPVG